MPNPKTIICKTISESADRDFSAPSSETEVDALATSAKARQEYLKEWDSYIDEKLIEWGLHPERFDEDDLEPPSPEAIGKACTVARSMRDDGCRSPTGVIPDGDGGIAFEIRKDPAYERIEIDEAGEVFYVLFLDCKFQSRYRLEIE